MTEKKAKPAYVEIDKVQQEVVKMAELAVKGLDGPALEELFSNAMATLVLAMKTTVMAVAYLERGDVDASKDAMTAMMNGLSTVIPSLITKAAALNGEERLNEISNILAALNKKPAGEDIHFVQSLDDVEDTPSQSAVEKRDAYYEAKFKMAEEANKVKAAGGGAV